MRIAERRDGVTAVQIENAPSVARVQVYARSVDDVERPLCIHAGEVIGGRRPGRRGSCGIHALPQVQPGAGAIRPAVSSWPSMRFIHCTAPPAAPLVRLSTAHITATVWPGATPDTSAKLLATTSLTRGSSPLTRTNTDWS